ncbi:MAG: rRNA pseudouridine synthase [Clostridiales bacterium]|jgi:23S rRNA pseudouridine955/2504/2580 synthase|nr:rRNA pseudouridine synthase [Clostridiales bacterium]
MRQLEITENEAEQRIDRFLLKYFNNTTRGNLYKLIRKKVFKVNGVRVKEDYFLKRGDQLEIFLSDESIEAMIKPVRTVVPDALGLDIVYEDDALLVVNKPKGLLTHPDKTEYKNTLATRVQFYLKNLCTSTFKPSPVHRLDKNTSGIVLFAKTYEALKHYNELMRSREVEKYYQCVVHGVVKKPGEVVGYLIKDEAANKVKLIRHAEDSSKYCHTLYRPIRVFGGFTLMEIKLITGRSHQIRASMQWIDHPIVGDLKYGGRRVGSINSQLLHSGKLIIEGKTFEAPSKEIEAFMAENGSKTS